MWKEIHSMKRFMMKQLFDWKNSPYRKPLILKGGQQSKNCSGWDPHYFWRDTGLPQGHKLHEILLRECSGVSCCLCGSLLGIALSKPSSFPVGKVNFMQIAPMTFTEFLIANGDENLAAFLDTVDTMEPKQSSLWSRFSDPTWKWHLPCGSKIREEYGKQEPSEI